jgi:hypothetical protein
VIGIRTPEVTLPPGDAISRAAESAAAVAREHGASYRCIGAGRLEVLRRDGTLTAWLLGARAIIIGLPDGYAIHEVNEDGTIGTIRERVYVERYPA